MPVEKYGSLWSHDELILALYLYCQLPFGQTTSRNQEVIRLANLLGRTPSSVARKLGNFGAFDPVLSARGVTGLTHFSKADQSVWEEFNGHWDLLVEASSQLLQQEPVAAVPMNETNDFPIISRPVGRTDQPRLVMTRLTQSFFRRAVLTSYQNLCCVCSLDFPSLLIASHIIPWSAREDTRTDPQNGLSLCALHDRAFDRGLMTITSNFTIVVSPQVGKSKSSFTKTVFNDFTGRNMILPNRFLPKEDYLKWHQDNVFRP
jgi:putative restriction endonuclease